MQVNWEWVKTWRSISKLYILKSNLERESRWSLHVILFRVVLAKQNGALAAACFFSLPENALSLFLSLKKSLLKGYFNYSISSSSCWNNLELFLCKFSFAAGSNGLQAALPAAPAGSARLLPLGISFFSHSHRKQTEIGMVC